MLQSNNRKDAVAAGGQQEEFASVRSILADKDDQDIGGSAAGRLPTHAIIDRRPSVVSIALGGCG